MHARKNPAGGKEVVERESRFLVSAAGWEGRHGLIYKAGVGADAPIRPVDLVFLLTFGDRRAGKNKENQVKTKERQTRVSSNGSYGYQF